MNAADMAAAAMAYKPPPPLPLPPGIASVRELPAMLRPVRKGPLCSRISKGQSISSSDADSNLPAGLTAGEGGAVGSKCVPTEDPQCEKSTSIPALSLAFGVAPAGDKEKRSGANSERGSPDVEFAAPTSEQGSEANPPSPQHKYLWACKSDVDIAKGIEQTLGDLDALERECLDLFSLFVAGSPKSSGSDEPRLEARRLQFVTQTIIDKLGCRADTVLERIGLIYSTVLSRSRSLSYVEFKSYVASVLTQIHRELDERSQDEQNGASFPT